ncbi:MAG: YjbH domain-containing protein, partial [Deltaproteobacteria bacterium]|nr:YjbH domain-containing protein [Deltaproteobacteria bacterium]
TFGRLSGGYIEKMYAGMGGEVLKFFGEGNMALGLSSDWVIKREPGTHFELQDFRRHTLLGKAYCTFPDWGLTLNATFGEFLAGDRGVLFEVSREYDTGVILGAWYSFTDTDDLTGHNRGYNDKGFFLSIPMRMFLTHDSRKRYNYGMSPWGRDVAATVDHWADTYWVFRDLMPAGFKSGIDKIKE